jgi:very-short-patch-repair endonuclease
MEEFEANSEIAAVTLAKRFKGWNAALASAGFDPSKARLSFTDLDLIEEIRRVSTILKHTPTTDEFNLHSSKASASTLTKRLGGSWPNACIAAGLQPPEHRPPTSPGAWNKGYRKFALPKDELAYLYETEGLSASSIGQRYGVSRGPVLRLMMEYGIPVKRLLYTSPRETRIETKLYMELERRGVTFVRQQVIDGLWVVDALVPGARMVIECDGEYWHSLPGAAERDKKKDTYLTSRGYKVFRFPEAAINADVKECVQRIVDALIDMYKRE